MDAPTYDDLALIAFEVQLYLADKHNLRAGDTALVFALALGETIAYSLTPGKTVDDATNLLIDEIKRTAQFRLENLPTIGLREMVDEYRRTGGKVRPN